MGLILQYESAVRCAIALGGDSDTIAAICGSIAAPFYGGVPENIALLCDRFLDGSLRSIMGAFEDSCRGVRQMSVKAETPALSDTLSVIRMEGKNPVFVVEKGRKDIKAAIGRFCLDDGVGVQDTDRRSNIDTATEDIAASRDYRINPQWSATEQNSPSFRIK